MREKLRPVVVALLCVLAIGLAAATLTSPTDPGGSGEGPDIPSSGGTSIETPADQDGTDAGAVEEGGGSAPEGLDFDYCVTAFEGEPIWLVILGILVVVGVAVSLVYGRYAGLTAAVVALWPAVILTLVLTAGCEAPTPTEQTVSEAANATDEAISAPGGGSGESVLTSPTSLIVLLLVVASIGLVAAAVLRGEGEESETPVEASPDDARTRARIGSVAGESADRLEDDATLENEVYRAWAGMAEPLPVERPETSTPAEFADAAIDAGISPDDVRELTGLFETVRYGTADPTEEREQRAVDSLRRIERAYSDGDTGPDEPASGSGPDGSPGDEGGR